MKARHIARELALLSLSQLSKNNESLQDINVDDLILNAVRTLNDYSHSNLKNTISDLLLIKEYLDDEEMNDPVNLESPIDAKIKPVELLNTKVIRKHIDTLLDSVDYVLHASEVAEMTALANKKEVKAFAVKLINTFVDKKLDVDQNIEKFSEGWHLERLLRMDLNILRLAITEIAFIEEVPNSVTVDEYVELSKTYSSEDSPRFINGILGQYISSIEGCALKEN